MPRIQYKDKKFRKEALDIIERANSVLSEYAAQGYGMNLRQLFYQFVSRAWITNKDSEYKRLGKIIGDARMAGLIDWSHLDDAMPVLLLPWVHVAERDVAGREPDEQGHRLRAQRHDSPPGRPRSLGHRHDTRHRGAADDVHSGQHAGL